MLESLWKSLENVFVNATMIVRLFLNPWDLIAHINGGVNHRECGVKLDRSSDGESGAL